MEDIEAIKQLKARYFRLLDTKKWAEWRTVFTDDARFEGLSRPLNGPDEFCEQTGAWLDPALTVHHGHMPEIELTGKDTARGIWAMYDRVQFEEPIEAGAYAGMTGFVGCGHYEEEYRRTALGWQISFLRLTRLCIEPIPTSTPFPTLPTGLLSSYS